MINKKIKANTQKAYELTYKYFDDNLSEANKVWESLIRHVTTLASTILVLSISFRKEDTLTYWNYLDWLMLFFSIFFGIIYISDSAYMYDKLARESLRTKLIFLYDELLKGHAETEIDATPPSVLNGKTWAGALSIILFLSGSFGMLLKIIGTNLQAPPCCYVIAYLTFIILIGSIIHTYREAIFKS